MLTDVAIRKEKPGRTPRKLFDFGGLYLLLNPDGAPGGDSNTESPDARNFCHWASILRSH
jgi:hypothetical protein